MHSHCRRAALAVALFLSASAVNVAHAQRIGIMAGVTFAQIHGADDLNLANRTGSEFGVSLEVPLGQTFALQPELWFMQKGSKFTQVSAQGATAGNIRLDYIEIPVLVRRDFAREAVIDPHLFVGPTFGFNVGCTFGYASTSQGSVGATDCNREDFKPKTLDYGLTLGGGVDLTVGGLTATGGLRYGIGLADIRSETSTRFRDRVHNGVLSAYLGVGFGHLKK